MDDRLSVKFELPGFEQIYKFTVDDQISDADAIQKVVDDAFIMRVLRQMQAMHQTRLEGLQRAFPPAEAEVFETII